MTTQSFAFVALWSVWGERGDRKKIFFRLDPNGQKLARRKKAMQSMRKNADVDINILLAVADHAPPHN